MKNILWAQKKKKSKGKKMLNSNVKIDSTCWTSLHQGRFLLQGASVCVCALKQIALLQPLLYARVKHRLIRVPVHVFDPGNRTDD